jgi:hypothetical protein
MVVYICLPHRLALSTEKNTQSPPFAFKRGMGNPAFSYRVWVAVFSRIFLIATFAIQYKLRRKATLSIHPSGPLSAGSAVDVSIQFERQDLVGRMVRFTLAEDENTTDNPARFRRYEKSESINALGQASCSFVLPSDAGEFERRIWRLFVVVKGFPLAPETLDLPVADSAGHIETASF